MADGVTFQSATPATPAAATVVATDDAGASGHVQIVKLAQSANGSATPVTVDADGVLVNLGTNNDVVISDGGGSVTVDGTVGVSSLPAGAGDGAIADGVSSAIKASVLDYVNSNPLAVRLSDTNGDYVAAGAGTQYTEDAAAAADPVGGMLIARRKDTLSATEVSADGDNIALNSTAKGELYVKQTDAVPVTDNGGSLTVDGSVAVSSMPATSGVVVEDVAGADAATLLAIAGQRNDTAAARTSTDGDWGTLALDSAGRVGIADLGGSITVDGSVSVGSALPAGANNIGDVDVLTLPAIPAGTNNIGDVDVLTLPALPAGTNNIGDVDVLTLPALPAGTNNIGDVDVLTLPAIPAGSNLIGQINPQPSTSGGLLIFRSLDLDETEEEAKATAGQVYGWFITNRATSARYVKFYNATAANVTVGTTTPVITLVIPGNATDYIAANALGGMGIAFDTAITVAATTGLADADTGAPGVSDVVINLFYK